MPISSDRRQARVAHLRAMGVTAGYDAVPVVKGVTVEVGLGELVAIIGPNGAGKSTFLKAVVGLLPVTAGTIEVREERVDRLRPDVIARKGVGYVPQVRGIFDDLTVRENLEIGGYTLSRRQLGSRIDQLFDQFPALAPFRRRQAGGLSGGERKLLAMARVLMTRPTVLVLDEPTANLSPAMAQLVLEETVPALARGGVAVLVVEQRAQAVLSVADWAYVLAGGVVVLEDVAANVLTRPDLSDVFLGRVARTESSGALGNG